MGKPVEHKHSRPKAKAAKKAHTCQVEGCKGAYRAKGYCNSHYRKWRDGQFGKDRYKLCSKPECKKRVAAKGMCDTHHTEWLAARSGKTAAAPAAPAAAG